MASAPPMGAVALSGLLSTSGMSSTIAANPRRTMPSLVSEFIPRIYSRSRALSCVVLRNSSERKAVSRG